MAHVVVVVVGVVIGTGAAALFFASIPRATSVRSAAWLRGKAAKVHGLAHDRRAEPFASGKRVTLRLVDSRVALEHCGQSTVCTGKATHAQGTVAAVGANVACAGAMQIRAEHRNATRNVWAQGRNAGQCSRAMPRVHVCSAVCRGRVCLFFLPSAYFFAPHFRSREKIRFNGFLLVPMRPAPSQVPAMCVCVCVQNRTAKEYVCVHVCNKPPTQKKTATRQPARSPGAASWAAAACPCQSPVAPAPRYAPHRRPCRRAAPCRPRAATSPRSPA